MCHSGGYEKKSLFIFRTLQVKSFIFHQLGYDLLKELLKF